MENEFETQSAPVEAVPSFYMGDLDKETYEILVDDKISTGG